MFRPPVHAVNKKKNENSCREKITRRHPRALNRPPQHSAVFPLCVPPSLAPRIPLQRARERIDEFLGVDDRSTRLEYRAVALWRVYARACFACSMRDTRKRRRRQRASRSVGRIKDVHHFGTLSPPSLAV